MKSPYGQNRVEQAAPATQLTCQNHLSELLGSGLKNLESPSLRLEKLLNYPIDSKTRNDGKATWDSELKAICNCANSWAGKQGNAPSPLKKMRGSKSFCLQLAARMMVNQSGSVLNLGLLLHRHYSCPYIPGSALKGIARHYVYDQYGEDGDFRRIFGEQDNAGNVAFLNAFPTPGRKWSLVVDVLTRHNDPADPFMDRKDPNPIMFPAVERGVQFEFVVAPARPGVPADDVALAAQWLREALKEAGVGAKTSAGYGWFKEA